MPGAIPHLIAGSAMFIIGRYYFKSYFDGDDKAKERFLLLFVCLSFTFIPDFFLIIYYTTKIFSFETALLYHDFVFIIVGPIAIFFLLLLKFGIKVKTKPVWIMGLWCIILHLIMDFFIPDNGIWF